MKRILLPLLLLLFMAGALGCQKKDAQEQGAAQGPHKLNVVTTLFPLYDFTREIAGDKAKVTLLLPPGVEPHSFEPRPEDVVTVSKADVAIYTSEYMEPWAVELLKSITARPAVIDTGRGVKLLRTGRSEEGHGAGEQGRDTRHRHGGVDPHMWLDFGNAQVMVQNIADGLSGRDPANKDYYQSRARSYKEQLQKLDDDFKAGLAQCRKKIFLHGGHYAFGYLAQRYGLTYLSAQAVDPDSEPTPQKLAGLVKEMRSNGLKYVYCEELLSPATADMIARETGAQVLMLNAAHNVSKEDFDKKVTFISLMRQNLENLKKGLECR